MPARRTHVHNIDGASVSDFARGDFAQARDSAEWDASRRGSTQPPLSSEAVLERGLWRERAAAQQRRAALTGRAGLLDEPHEPDALEWVPAPTFGERILRAVSVPAAVGTGVFLVAVVIAIVLTMLQFQPARAAQAGGARASDAQSVDQQASETSSEVPTDSTGASEPKLVSVPTGATTGGTNLTVHVVGEVASPGVVEVPPGTRVGDAIAAAGGATDQAVLDAVNLARVVVDGEQIVVPDEEGAATVPAPLQAGAGSTPNSAGGTPAAVPINLNAADLASLETLPGIGPALAQRILDWRHTHGSFQSVDQLLEVPGVGEKIFAGLEPQVTL